MSMWPPTDIGPPDKSAQRRIPELGSADPAQASGVGVQALGSVVGDEEEFPRLHSRRSVAGGDVGLNNDGHAVPEDELAGIRLPAAPGGARDGATGRGDDGLQVTAAEAVREVVDGGEAGLA